MPVCFLSATRLVIPSSSKRKRTKYCRPHRKQEFLSLSFLSCCLNRSLPYNMPLVERFCIYMMESIQTGKDKTTRQSSFFSAESDREAIEDELVHLGMSISVNHGQQFWNWKWRRKREIRVGEILLLSISYIRNMRLCLHGDTEYYLHSSPKKERHEINRKYSSSNRENQYV